MRPKPTSTASVRTVDVGHDVYAMAGNRLTNLNAA
ncbi:MAG: hypothetical protein RLZZ232_1063 [Planctomycetota bacterium]|jgi:hypothetical protein